MPPGIRWPHRLRGFLIFLVGLVHPVPAVMIEDQLETHVMEKDLSIFSSEFFLAFNHNKSVPENVNDSFTHFSQKANLSLELTPEELAAFKERVAEEVGFEIDHDGLNHSDPAVWKQEFARALEDQKPICTKLLEKVLNQNNTAWSAELKEWMVNLSAHDLRMLNGLIMDSSDKEALDRAYDPRIHKILDVANNSEVVDTKQPSNASVAVSALALLQQPSSMVEKVTPAFNDDELDEFDNGAPDGTHFEGAPAFSLVEMDSTEAGGLKSQGSRRRRRSSSSRRRRRRKKKSSSRRRRRRRRRSSSRRRESSSRRRESSPPPSSRRRSSSRRRRSSPPPSPPPSSRRRSSSSRRRREKAPSPPPPKQEPGHFDPRKQWPECAELIGTVRDQGKCGSCWAFAIVGSMDARLCIESDGKFRGESAFVSAGYIASCGNRGQNGCGGGNPGAGYNWVAQNGAPTGGHGSNKKTCVPYFGTGDSLDHFNGGGRSPPCPSSCSRDTQYSRSLSDDKFYAAGVGRQIKDLTQAKNALDQGPIPFGFAVYRDFMQYKGGIYTPRGGQKTGMHAVVAIGYGPDYILAVNSWGERWGDRGLFKIQPGCCDMVFWVPTATPVDKGAFPVPNGGKNANFRRRTAPAPRPPPPPGGGGG